MSHAKFFLGIYHKRGVSFPLPVAGLDISGNPRDLGAGLLGALFRQRPHFKLDYLHKVWVTIQGRGDPYQPTK